MAADTFFPDRVGHLRMRYICLSLQGDLDPWKQPRTLTVTQPLLKFMKDTPCHSPCSVRSGVTFIYYLVPVHCFNTYSFQLKKKKNSKSSVLNII